MAFITTNADKAKLGPRLSELISVSKSMDMLVGFFYFSGVKVIEEQLLANKEIKLRILVACHCHICYLGYLLLNLHDSSQR